MAKNCICCDKTIGMFDKRYNIASQYVCNNCFYAYFACVEDPDSALQKKTLISNLIKQKAFPKEFTLALDEEIKECDALVENHIKKQKQIEEENRKIEQEKQAHEKDLFDLLLRNRNYGAMREFLLLKGLSGASVDRYFDIVSKRIRGDVDDSSLDILCFFVKWADYYSWFSGFLSYEEGVIRQLTDAVFERKKELLQPVIEDIEKKVNERKKEIQIPEINYDKSTYGSWFYITIPFSHGLSSWMHLVYPLTFEKIYVEIEDVGKNTTIYKYKCVPRHTITSYSSPVVFSRNDDEDKRFQKIQNKVIEIDLFEKNNTLNKTREELSNVLKSQILIVDVVNEKEPVPPHLIGKNNIEKIINELRYKFELNLDYHEPLPRIERIINNKLESMLGEVDLNNNQLEILVPYIAKDNHRIDLINKEIVDEYNDKLELFSLRKSILETDYYKYGSRSKQSIEKYVYSILYASSYPIKLERNIIVEFDENCGRCIVEYQLPTEDDYPAIKEYQYKATENRVIEIKEKQSALSKSWTSLAYSICLRSIQEIFSNNESCEIKTVVFNGWVLHRNKATGKEENNRIMSLQCTREEFENIDIKNVDSVACFKSLKGVSAAILSDCIPVQPIQSAEKTDSRFIEARNIAEYIDEGTNIATMDWQDFEHLIRELFEKVFSADGSEVKITQSSRDGGVDAVVFDNDPIKGGKIIIQAKRYTNTVGVSAVRDLYGTILNEGAMKGILVTTSTYGSDSYAFAADKPITLLSGGHLKWLLNKYGYHAKIDLEEARKINESRNQ